MFDVGFTELLLIGVVALLVIGPERLPKVARTAGLWVGKGRRFLSSVKAEVEQELRTEELKRVLAEQAKSNPVHDIIDDIGKTTGDIKAKAESTVKGVSEAAKSATGRKDGASSDQSDDRSSDKSDDRASAATGGTEQNDGPEKH